MSRSSPPNQDALPGDGVPVPPAPRLVRRAPWRWRVVKINRRVLWTCLVPLVQLFSLKIPPPPPPSCLSVREWWVPAGLNRGHHGRATAAAWPRHGVSPSLCGDTGCQRGQIMSWWPPKEGCRSHRATSWALPASLWPHLAPLPPLVAHMASPRANGGLPVGPNHVPVGHPVDPPSSFALTAGADGTQPHLWPPQKS